MIKSVDIRNFQSHHHTYLEFDGGLNIITGTSDHGKSAVIRAIGWVLHNKPSGDAFRTWGTKEDTMVTLTFDDGNVIKRVRGDKLNQYEVNGEVFKALRSDVPEQVTGITKMQDVNFQPQNESYFLLNETPGNVAKKINAVADLAIMDQTLQASKEAVKSLKGSLTHVEDNIKGAKISIANMDYLPGMISSMEELERQDAEITGLKNNILRVREFSESLVVLKRELDSMIPESASKEAFVLIKTQEELGSKKAVIESLSDLVHEADDSAYELEAYSAVDSASGKLSELTDNYSEIIRHSKDVADAIYLSTTLKTKAMELEICEAGDAIYDLEGLISLNKTIMEISVNLESNAVFIHDLKQCSLLMEEVEEEVEVEVMALNKFKEELGVCPLCEGEFK